MIAFETFKMKRLSSCYRVIRSEGLTTRRADRNASFHVLSAVNFAIDDTKGSNKRRTTGGANKAIEMVIVSKSLNEFRDDGILASVTQNNVAIIAKRFSLRIQGDRTIDRERRRTKSAMKTLLMIMQILDCNVSL